MVDFVDMGAVALAFLVVTASPGPATIALANVSMASGRKSGLHFGLGLSFGLAFWGLIAASGIGAILQASNHALVILKIVGGAYLLWLAARSANSACQQTAILSSQISSDRWLKRGLFLNLSNPKAVVAWMATLSIGTNDYSHAGQIALMTILCVALGFIIYTTYSLAFSLPGVMAGYSTFRKWIDGIVAGLFVVAGFGLLRSAWNK